MRKKGLKPEGEYSYGNKEISVTDVQGDNALLGADGKVYFIDPIINVKRPILDIIENRKQASDNGNSQISEGKKCGKTLPL